MRTRTAVPVGIAALGGQQHAAVERQQHQPVIGRSRDGGLEHRAEADGLAQPGEVRAAHQRRHRPVGDAPAALEQQDVRGQPHHVVEVVGDEDHRQVERPAQRVDFVLKAPPHLAIDGGKRFVEKQDGRLAGQRPGERHALTLAAGQFLRPAIRLVLPAWTDRSNCPARERRSACGRCPSAATTFPSAVR